MASILKYNKDIDGLRAIAVLLVCFFHTDFPFFKNGFIGVDIFFVISGYLITRLLFSEINSDQFSFLQFYGRRIRRLFPMMFFTLFFTILIAALFYPPNLLVAVSKTVLASVLYISNFQIWNSTGYFSQNLQSVPLLHTWSLAIEEQFYLIFPFFFYWSVRIFKNGYIVFLFCSMLVSLLICFNYFLDWNNLNFFFTISRGWEFLVGSLVWYLGDCKWIINRSVSFKNVTTLLGIALIFISLISYIPKDNYPGWATFLPVLGGGLVLLFSGNQTIINNAIGSKYLVIIGKSSYSFYLLHFPVIMFCNDILKRELGMFEKIILFFVLLGLSVITYTYIESPFRNNFQGKHRKVFYGALIATIAMFLLSVLLINLKGIPSRFSKEQNQIFEGIKRSPLIDSCHWDSFKDPTKGCKIFNDNLKWAVLGDSHGVELSYTLAKSLETRNQGLLELTVSGCQPSLNYDAEKKGNKEWFNNAVNYLNKSKNIENVVLVFRHTFYLYGTQLINYPEVPKMVTLKIANKSSNEVLELYWDSFRSTVESLSLNGKKVFIICPIPELGKNVVWNIYSGNSFFTNKLQEYGPNYDYYKRRNGFIMGKLATENWPPNVHIVQSFNCLSKNGQVTAISDSNSLYFDDNHLSLEGSKLIVNELLKESNK